jgi:hypothetical protein
LGKARKSHSEAFGIMDRMSFTIAGLGPCGKQRTPLFGSLPKTDNEDPVPAGRNRVGDLKRRAMARFGPLELRPFSEECSTLILVGDQKNEGVFGLRLLQKTMGSPKTHHGIA